MFCYKEASKGGQQKEKHRKYHSANINAHPVATRCLPYVKCYIKGFLYIYLKFQNPGKWILSQLLSVPQRDLSIYYLYFGFQMSELVKQSEFIKYVANRNKGANSKQQIEAAERWQNIIKSGASNTQQRQLRASKHPIRHITYPRSPWGSQLCSRLRVLCRADCPLQKWASRFSFPLQAFLDYEINRNLGGNGLTSGCSQRCNVL